jgi:hypothetical protein
MGMTAAPPAPALNLVSDSEPPAECLAEYFILPLAPPPIDIECDCCYTTNKFELKFKKKRLSLILNELP